MMLSLLLMAQVQLVTFSAPVASAGVVLPQLGRRMGLNLYCDSTAARLPLLIDVRGADPDALLAEIGNVSHGTWEPVKGGKRLAINLQKLASEDTAAQKAWLQREAVGKGKDAHVERSLTPAELEVLASGSYEAGVATDPSNRAVVRILNGELAESLANVRPGQRVLWLESPRPGQLRLPAAAVKIVRNMRKERLQVEKLARSRFAGAPAQDQFEDQPGQALLVAQRPIGSNWLKLTFGIAAGPQGRLVWYGLSVLWGAPAAAPEFPKVDVPMSVETAALARYLKNWDRTALTPTLRVKFSSPLQTDPLELVAAPQLRAAASALGKGIVACLPDDLLTMLNYLEPDRNPLSKVLGASSSVCAVEVGDRVLISPRNLLSCLAGLWDRKALDNFFQTARRERGITVSNVGQLMRGQSMPLFSGTWPVRAAEAGATRGFDAARLLQAENHLSLPFVASLGPAEAELAATEGIVGWSRLLGRVNLTVTSSEQVDVPGFFALAAEGGEPEGARRIFLSVTEEPAYCVGETPGREAAFVLASLKKGATSAWATAKIAPLLRRTYILRWLERDAAGKVVQQAEFSRFYEDLPAGPSAVLADLPEAWRRPLGF